MLKVATITKQIINTAWINNTWLKAASSDYILFCLLSITIVPDCVLGANSLVSQSYRVGMLITWHQRTLRLKNSLSWHHSLIKISQETLMQCYVWNVQVSECLVSGQIQRFISRVGELSLTIIISCDEVIPCCAFPGSAKAHHQESASFVPSSTKMMTRSSEGSRRWTPSWCWWTQTY